MGAAGLDWKEEAEMTKKENEWLEKEGLTQESEEGEFTGGGGEAGSEGGISVAPDGLPGMPASKQTTEERTREIQQKNDKDLKFTDHRNRKERDLFLVGEGNSLQEKRIAQQLKSEVEGFGLVGEFETPEIDEAHDHGSREDWQRALENSKIPQEAKQYIKSMENQVVDGWENSFDGLWGQVEPQLKAYGSISEADISHMLVNSILDHIKHIDLDRFENDLNGIFHNGKLHSYEALNFEEYKRDKKGFKKSSVTMDSMEDDLLLRSMRERLKEHLVKLTNATLKAEMVDKIAGSLKEAVDKSASSSELKESIKKVYNDALWRLQSAVRTETTNNFTIATLLGLKEQGIKKAKWNAHNDHKTCPVCRGYNGLEFTVDYLLSLGPYPLVKMSHPQCRCWFTSVIGHVVSPIIEKALLPYRKKFPSATEEVKVPVATKKDFKVLKSEFKNVPAEYEKSIKSIRNRTQNTSFNEMWPKNVEFVPDVADSSKFIEIYGKRDDLRNRVQYWKDGSGKVWVSNFYIQDKDPNTAIIRIWAENIYSKVRSYWEKAYEQKMEVKRVPDISQDTVDRIASVLSPIPIVIPFRVGMLSGVSLNKKFRDQSDGEVRNRLVEAGVNDTDVESIVNWRTINPSWAQTGKVIEIGKKDLQQEGFVNEIAKRSAKDLFIESTANYVGDGFLLEFRDPKSYQHLKSTIFQGKKFY
jgi:SPP1 gp7 family putative phage head morphogenesis protein